MLLFVLLLIPALAFSHYLAEHETNDQELIQVVHEAYAKGAKFDLHTVSAGSAVVPLIPVYAGSSAQLQADELSGIRSANAGEVKSDVKLVSLKGDRAIALVKVYQDGDELYRDYVALHKIQGKWKVNGRVHHVHS